MSAAHAARRRRSRAWTGAVVVCIAGIAAGCLPEMESPDKMVAAARALDQRFVEAVNRGDVDAVMATYWNSPNLVVYPFDGDEARGWAAARAGVAASLGRMPGSTLELTEAHYEVMGDLVFSWGKWRLSRPAKTGAPARLEGRFSDVKAKRNGRWVYILEHSSVPFAPAAPDSVR